MSAPVERIPVEEPISTAIPQELWTRPQWLAWWSVLGADRPEELPNGRPSGVLKVQAKPHKLPIDPATGGLAASTRSVTWSSAEHACAAGSEVVTHGDRLRVH